MIGRSKINNLQYVDATLVLTASEKKVTFIMFRFRMISERYGLKLNQNKINLIILDKPNNYQLCTLAKNCEISNSKTIQLLVFINYKHRRCREEIRRCIAKKRTATAKLW